MTHVLLVPIPACNCHRHAVECYFNATVSVYKLSLNKEGVKQGGGVCIDCLHHSAGECRSQVCTKPLTVRYKIYVDIR